MDFGMPVLIENKNIQDSITLCKDLGLGFIELNMNLPEYQAENLENTGYFKVLQMRNRNKNSRSVERICIMAKGEFKGGMKNEKITCRGRIFYKNY